MAVLLLYEFCLRKIAINLRNGIYRPKNPFRTEVPSMVANDIMSSVLDYQRANGFRVEDLEQLLISGKLKRLKIYDINAPDCNSKWQIIIKILDYLKMGCEKLEKLHLLLPCRYQILKILQIWEALGIILKTTPDLEVLNCCFSFDLKALINCKKLRKLKLHFNPQQHWYDFLEKVENGFQTHKCLELFIICHCHVTLKNVPYGDIAIILRHCPELTSLGYIESSGLLSHLHGILPFDLKLRHCYWEDLESENNVSHRVGEAIQNYPLIQELDFYYCRFRSVPFLRNLRNLVYLNITLDASVSGDAFNGALQIIGSHLKHLSLQAVNPMDISLLLQNCLNLESLKIFDCGFAKFTHPSVCLRNLKRLSLDDDKERPVLSLFRDCNKLTELFLMDLHFLHDDSLCHFLKRNSLLNLKVADFYLSKLTEHGLRELFRNAPQLEYLYIFPMNGMEDTLKRVIFETSHRVLLCNGVSSLKHFEFFHKRRKRYEC